MVQSSIEGLESKVAMLAEKLPDLPELRTWQLPSQDFSSVQIQGGIETGPAHIDVRPTMTFGAIEVEANAADGCPTGTQRSLLPCRGLDRRCRVGHR
jgi:hypothetical protein